MNRLPEPVINSQSKLQNMYSVFLCIAYYCVHDMNDGRFMNIHEILAKCDYSVSLLNYKTEAS